MVAQSPEPGAHGKNARLFTIQLIHNITTKITTCAKINLEYNIKPS